MFNSRRATIDPDINVEGLRSCIVREMIGSYDSYAGESASDEIFFIDPYQRFFFSMLDSHCEFRADIGDYIDKETGELDKEYYSIGTASIELPVFRVIYTLRHHRGKGIQQRILEEVKEVSDACGESFAIFADPFIISGFGREVTASEALMKFVRNGYEPTPEWADDLYKQRRRFLATGFNNVKYPQAQLTQPYQHFVYISRNAAPEERKLLESLKVHYYHRDYDAPRAADQ